MSKKRPICPLLKKECIEHDCMWFSHVTMKNPQTGKDEDEFDCVVRWLPVLLIQGAKQTCQVQAAVESFRNETIQRQDALNTTLVATQILPAISVNGDTPRLE